MKTDSPLLGSARVVVWATGYLRAQAPGTGAIAGTAMDPSGALVATPEGGFRLPLLPPGNDSMAVEEGAQTRSLALGRVSDQSLILDRLWPIATSRKFWPNNDFAEGNNPNSWRDGNDRIQSADDPIWLEV